MQHLREKGQGEEEQVQHDAQMTATATSAQSHALFTREPNMSH